MEALINNITLFHIILLSCLILAVSGAFEAAKWSKRKSKQPSQYGGRSNYKNPKIK